MRSLLTFLLFSGSTRGPQFLEQQHQQVDGSCHEDDPSDQQRGNGPQASGQFSNRLREVIFYRADELNKSNSVFFNM